MSHSLQEPAGAASSSDKDGSTTPPAQATPMSPSTSHPQGSPSKENSLSEKYKKLKRRFFELEERHKETSTELQRSGERNVRMREERNMLLDRIIELEQQQNQNDASPTIASNDFPRTLLHARARTSFIENLRQAIAEDNADEDVDPATTATQTYAAEEEQRADDHAWEKRSPRRNHSYPPSSPKGKDVEGAIYQSIISALAPLTASEQRTTVSDNVNASHEVPRTNPDNQAKTRLISCTRSVSPPVRSTDPSMQQPVAGSQTGDQRGPTMTLNIDASADTDPVAVDRISHGPKGSTSQPSINQMDIDFVTEQTTVALPGMKANSKGKGVVRNPRKRARKEGAPSLAESGRRTSARLARNTTTDNEASPKASRVSRSNEPRMVLKTGIRASPSRSSEGCFSAPASPPPPSEPPTSGTATTTSSPTTSKLKDNAQDYIDPLLKATASPNPSSPPPNPTSTSQTGADGEPPSPSMDDIVKVAAAVVAAQNAARASTSSSTSATASPTPDQGQSTKSADTPSSSLPSPSPISHNPYLVLAMKPGAGSNPVGMPPMMHPMNPYSMYYPTPGASGTSPYPYANPYYYMPPIAGPSTVYPPPPPQPKNSSTAPSPTTPRLPSDVQRAAKPKRLKAHTVTSKQFSIPVVPRDKNDKPMLPLNVGIMTVLSLGSVCMREHFHTERYIFPVGYEVTRRYMSTIDPNHDVVYHCTILDGGDGPKFQIIPADCPDRPVIAGTATGAWSTIVRQANLIRNRQHSNSVSGPDFFGLGQNTIKHLIQQLPNSDKLRDYVWQHFVEGGPLGGRHAAVIPALPDEYDNILPLSAMQHHEKHRNVPPPDPTRGLSYYPQHIIQQAQQQQQERQQEQQP